MTWIIVLALGSAQGEPEGLVLARRHCVKCHLLPRPEMLPRSRWPFIMRWMGNYAGHRDLEGVLSTLVDPVLAPSRPTVPLGDLDAVRDYYMSLAPDDGPPAPDRPATAPFEPVRIPDPGAPGPVTMVHLDPRQDRLTFGVGRRLIMIGRHGRPLLDAPLPSEVAHLEPRGDGFRLSLIGHFHRDEGEGRILDIDSEFTVRPILEGFHRLAGHRSADLDGDGSDDVVAIGFGDHSVGRVSILWSRPADGIRESMLLDRSGAVAAGIADVDSDGRPDVLLLTAQARQELLLYRNRGGRSFEKTVVLEKPPGFGFNDLAVADMNGDGAPDAVLVNGNNMELPDPPRRPYHGIRVLLNDGSGGFRQKAFVRFDGAIRCVPADFDGDGDVDLAAVSFYPDWSARNPRTVLFLEQRGSVEFHAQAVDAPWGRWLSVDAGDWDGDGRLDLLLGGASLTAGIPSRHLPRHRAAIRKAPRTLLLRNTSRRRS